MINYDVADLACLDQYEKFLATLEGKRILKELERAYNEDSIVEIE